MGSNRADGFGLDAHCDPQRRSLAMGNLLSHPRMINDSGRMMDQMVRNGGALSAVGWKLQRFVLDIWHANFPEELLIGNQDGPSLPDTEMAKLQGIYGIRDGRKHQHHTGADVLFAWTIIDQQESSFWTAK